MNRLLVFFLLIITFAAGTVVSEAKEFSLTIAERSYAKALTKINVSYTAKLRSVSIEYGKMLRVFKAESKKAGDLEKTLAAQKEAKRFYKENAMPEESPIDLPAELVIAQSNYTKEIAKAKTDKNKAVLDLVKQYTAYLDIIKRKMVSADKIEEAIKIKAAIEKVELSPVVSAARFAAADSATVGEQPVSAIVPADKKLSDADFEIINYTKSIRA